MSDRERSAFSVSDREQRELFVLLNRSCEVLSPALCEVLRRLERELYRRLSIADMEELIKKSSE